MLCQSNQHSARSLNHRQQSFSNAKARIKPIANLALSFLISASPILSITLIDILTHPAYAGGTGGNGGHIIIHNYCQLIIRPIR